MANPLISVLLGVFVYGLIWAALYDTMNTSLPTQNPVGVSESNPTWCVLIWIWDAAIPVLAFIMGIGSMGTKGRTNLSSTIILYSGIVFVCWTILIIMWLILYNPMFHIIPDAFLPVSHSTPPAYLLTIFNSATVLLMVGLPIGIIARST